MTEILGALLIFLAVICFGRFLDTGKLSEATGFGIFAAARHFDQGEWPAFGFSSSFGFTF